MKHVQRVVLFLFVSALITGCGRQQQLSYAFREEMESLPEAHRQGIQEALLKLYGTPHNPLMRTIELPEESDEEMEEEETEETEDDAASEAEGAESAADDGRKYVDVGQYDLHRGAMVYNARCSGCHGITGDGQGEAGAYLMPKPRDYRSGVFKFTSTPYGAKPVRQDLVRTIRRGAKGTSMPAFPWMTDEDLNAVIDYVIMLSTRGEVESYVVGMSEDYEEDEAIEPFEFLDAIELVTERWGEAQQQVVLPVTAEPRYDEESVAAGFSLFRSQGCSKCHGEDGKGQTEWLSRKFIEQQEALPEAERVAINYDAWGDPAPAADITARLLHGGRRPIDLYRRIHTGINGTPMPAFSAMFAAQPDNTWHLVHYILHIIEGGDPDLAGADGQAEEADGPAEAAPNQAAFRGVTGTKS